MKDTNEKYRTSNRRLCKKIAYSWMQYKEGLYA